MIAKGPAGLHVHGTHTCTCATAPGGATEGQSQALGLSSLAFGFYFAYLVGTGNAAALGIPALPMYFWCIYNALTGLVRSPAASRSFDTPRPTSSPAGPLDSFFSIGHAHLWTMGVEPICLSLHTEGCLWIGCGVLSGERSLSVGVDALWCNCIL